MPHSRRLILEFDSDLIGDPSGTNPPLSTQADVNVLRVPELAFGRAYQGAVPSASKVTDGSTSTYIDSGTGVTAMALDFWPRKRSIPKKLRIYVGASYRPKDIALYGFKEDDSSYWTGTWVTLCTGTCADATGWVEFTITTSEMFTWYGLQILNARSTKVYLYEVEIIGDIINGCEDAFTLTETSKLHVSGPDATRTLKVTAVRPWAGWMVNWVSYLYKSSWLNDVFDKIVIIASKFKLQKKYETLTTDQNGKTVTYSNQYSTSYPASAAFDGSTSTYWRTDLAPTQWAQVDYGSQKYINRLRVYIGNVTYAPKNWTLKGSNDGSSFTTVASGTCTNSATGWQQWDFQNHGLGTFRYYRFEVTSRYSTRTYVYEVELSGLMYEPLGSISGHEVDCTNMTDVIDSTIYESGNVVPTGTTLLYYVKVDSGSYQLWTPGSDLPGVSGDMSASKIYIKMEMTSTVDRNTPEIAHYEARLKQNNPGNRLLELLLQPNYRLRKPESIRIQYNSVVGTLEGDGGAVDPFDLNVSTFNNLRLVPNPYHSEAISGVVAWASSELQLHLCDRMPGYHGEEISAGIDLTINLYVSGTEPV